MSRTFSILFFLIGTSCIFAQSQRKNTYTAVVTNITYGIHTPAGDLADRFGNNFSIGGGFDVLTERHNWIVGIKGNNLFGNTVKEDVIASLRDADGFILGNNRDGQGDYAIVALRERGFYAGGHIGKLWGISKKNSRSGIRVTVGVGLLQHKVRIQDESGTAQSLAGAYIKGYDQLSNGLALEQFIGYQHLSTTRGFNFFAGFEFTEAFTQNRRAVNFAIKERDTTQRRDILVGFRIGWSIPIYIGERGEDLRY